VRSHGPVPRSDLAGWTGLTLADTAAAVAAAGDALTTVEVDGLAMLVASGAADDPPPLPDTVLALPGLDEYLLGYKNRALMVDPADAQAIIPGGNGFFQATIVRAGRVIGTWTRSSSTAGTVVSVVPLKSLRSRDRREVESAFERYAHFVDTPVQVRWP